MVPSKDGRSTEQMERKGRSDVTVADTPGKSRRNPGIIGHSKNMIVHMWHSMYGRCHYRLLRLLWWMRSIDMSTVLLALSTCPPAPLHDSTLARHSYRHHFLSFLSYTISKRKLSLGPSVLRPVFATTEACFDDDDRCNRPRSRNGQ